MRKVILIVVALVAIYLLAAPLSLGQSEKIAKAKGENVEEQIAGDPTLQAPCAHVEIKDGRKEVEWDLIYPASKASYVGGTVKKMHMSAGLRWLLLQDRQFSRKGQIALTPGCLLFVFNNDKQR